MRHRDTVAVLIFLGSRLHFKAIKGSSLATDADLGQRRADFSVEAIFVHPEKGWRIAQPNKSRLEWAWWGRAGKAVRNIELARYRRWNAALPVVSQSIVSLIHD
jgi:hypothetical protein